MNKFQDVKNNYTNVFKSYETRGFQKIASSNSLFFKIFWIIYFLVTISLAIYFTTKAIISYLQYDVIQKTEKINQNQITFPTITLCSDIFIDGSIKNYINTCSFNLNDDCKINPDNYFEMFRSYSTGRNCFQFNDGKNMFNNSIPIQNSTLPEKLNGFILYLTTSKSSKTQSIYIYIDDPSSPSFINQIDFKNPDYSLDTNYEYDITLTKTITEHLEMPYNPCYKNAYNDFSLNKTIINFFQSNNIPYKQINCYKLCAQLDYINTNPCNCKNTSLGNIIRDCEYNKDKILFNCTHNYLENFILKRNLYCQQYCPLECDSIDYTFVLRSSSSNLTRLFIYFNQLKYEHNFEVPAVLLLDLLSSIGGVLQLFMGLGLVSLLEYCQFSLISFSFVCRKKKIKTIDDKKSILEEIKKKKYEIINEVVDEIKTQIKNNDQQETSSNKQPITRKIMNEAKIKLNVIMAMKNSEIIEPKMIDETKNKSFVKKKTTSMISENREYSKASRYMDWYYKNNPKIKSSDQK
jgi:hypothetical protein